MSNILSFEFEELPLVIANGIPAALTNGCAEIKYSRDGSWHVESVSVEGHQTLTAEERARGLRPWIYVACPDDLADMIVTRLESDWSDRVQDHIDECLASDREDAAEQRADMRRDHMMGM